MKQILFKKYRRHILYFEMFLLLFLLALTYNFVPVKGRVSTFYIPESNIQSVVETLEKYGYTVTLIDRLMLQLIRTPERGWYSVDTKMHSRLLFYEYLYKKRAEMMDVVVFAGETSVELSERLANDIKLDGKKLLRHYKRLSLFQEADIFAQRYTVARKADEKRVMEYLFHISSKQLKAFEKTHFSDNVDEMTLKVLLTIASIIQKESNSVREMPLISSVIHNRLEKGMRLQMDSTLNYGEYSHVIVTPERIRSDESYYNTYKYKGLPPAPLSTVTPEALKAALLPDKSDYIYFMLTPSGEHNFSVTYEEHLESIRAFRRYQKRKKEQNSSLSQESNRTI